MTHVDSPFAGVFDGLKSLRYDLEGLETAFDRLHEQMRVLDEAPRHDSVLSDALCERACGSVLGDRSLAFMVGLRELGLSQDALTRALGAINGAFRGELKVKLEDRLARHLEETIELVRIFEEISQVHNPPRKPYLIRQHSLSSVVLDLYALLDKIQEIRHQAKSTDLDEVHCRLMQAANNLYRLGAQLKRCRDNPSQKMGEKAAAWKHEYASIFADLQCIKAKCMFECLRAGIVFRGRCNEITAQWVDSMADADPWCFDHEPHMQAHWRKIEGTAAKREPAPYTHL